MAEGQPIDDALKNLKERLKLIAGKECVFEHEPMQKHTTFRIGGPADILVTPRDAASVAAAVQACNEADVPWRVMGRGSNLLVSDAGLRGVTIKFAKNFSDINMEGACITAEAGASNAAVAAQAQRAGLAGFEFAAGIPGTIGGAAVMNAGAYGGEFAQVCESVTCLNAQGVLEVVSAHDAQWSYRHSAMIDNGSIVLSATLRLTPDDPQAIQERMANLQKRREEKQPLNMPSAGSTFKRPEGYFAGKLIEDAGLRGFSLGGAQVSEKHCGFVVNAGGATAQDVRDLISYVQQKVFEHDGVHLEPEVRLWGFGE